MTNYGLPLMGSKSKVVKRIFEILTTADTFVDLFGGGGAVTHYAATTGRYKNIIYNEINPMMADSFKKAINGEFNAQHEWISHDEFFERKNKDAYVAMCFSFGNCLRSYAYSAAREPLMRAIFKAVLGDISEFDAMGYDTHVLDGKNDEKQRWTAIKRYMQGKGIALYNVEPISRLARIKALADIPNKENISIYNKDYQEVEIPDRSIVYCDIPYKNTGYYTQNGRKANFDYERFYKFALECRHPIYISEYDMPNDFIPIASFMRKELFLSNKTKTIERIFVPKTQYQREKSISLFDTEML